MGRGPKPAKAKVEAKPPAARKSRKSEGSKVRDLEKRLAEALQRETEGLKREAEALEQQSATAEILRIIGSSPADAQPVFDAIAVNAVRLCDAKGAVVVRYDGALLHVAAHHNVNPEGVERFERQFPRAPDRHFLMGRAVLDGTVVHVPDLQAAAEFSESVGRQSGVGSNISIPLLRQGRAIGAIGIARQKRGPFSDAQIELLRTFADQAVIAIENARLFNETKEALERQTATSEILRAIAGSPTEIQPVLDTVAENAARVCGATDAVVSRIEQGDVTRIVAGYGPIPKRRVGEQGLNLIRESIAGRTMLERRTVHVHDILSGEGDEFPLSRELQRQIPTQPRTILSTPLLREGVSIGALLIRRTEVQPFTDRQIELLKTFADQAVIAIENVRLFKELQEKNQALTQAHAQVTESLDHQTATSEILQVISRSPTDVQPVFDAIAKSALHLCDSSNSVVGRYDGELLHLAAHAQQTSEAAEALRGTFPMRPNRATASGRALLEGCVVHIPNAQVDSEYAQPLAEVIRARAVLAVPILRDGQPIGTIAVGRLESRPFSDKQIALLQTFADQAVIAIENVRLFNETKEALERQTATAEILRAISGSPTDVQPVFDAIVQSAVRLCDGVFSIVLRFDGEVVHFAAQHNFDPNARAVYGRWFPRRVADDHLLARVLVEQRILNLADVTTEFRFVPGQQEQGFRSVLWVPMIRDGVSVGAIGVSRLVVEPFPDNQVELLKTFADQAVIAIENVRLFKELEVANRELAAASQHKSEFLANMSHELRTPLNAIIGFSEVLSERMFGELNEKQEEYSKDIHASGQHLLSLINDILDLSKIEAGRMELELTDFHLPAALDSALTLVRERAGRRSIALHLSVDKRLGQIQADERKVRQVVLNLLSNAIKFTPEGGRIDVAAMPKDGFVEVAVRDTGVGIAPEDQEAVFEEFRQVGTADKKVEGTGLGLTLCRKFVELHGGKIWVKSQPGAGSTFTFTIPTGT